MDPFNLAILAVTWLMMLTVGLAIRRSDWSAVRGTRKLVVATLVAQWLVLPLLALGMARGLGLTPALTAALVLLAACPIGDIINFYTVAGKGNVPLAVVLNALSCLVAPVAMGIVFAGLRAVWPQDLALSPPPWVLVVRVLLLALVPIALGYTLRARWPASAARWLAPCGRLAGAGIVLVLGWALVRQRDHLAAEWHALLPAVILFLAASFGIGTVWARAWRLSRPEHLPVAFAYPVRNVALAAALASSLLNRPEFLSLYSLYFLLEVPVFLLLARAGSTPLTSETTRSSDST